MNKKTVKDVDVQGKKVLMRVDFNVPLDENLNVTDDKRIAAAMPTIEYLLQNNAQLILMSHLGRPKGAPEAKFSLAPAAKRLGELLPKTKVIFAKDTVGESAKAAVAAMKNGEVVLLENLRFNAGETKNNPDFAKELATIGAIDVYVDDAFGSCHRAHASTEGVSKYIPVAVAGMLMAKELDMLGSALDAPARPFVAVLGGAKISDKIGVIKNLLSKCDSLIIGGGMANTFIKAMGHPTAASLVDEASLALANELMAQAKANNVEMLLPCDLIVADKFAADASTQVVAIDGIPEGYMALDIGPASAAKFAEVVKNAMTVVWNGPMGVFEMPAFAEGTKAVAQACAHCKGTTIIGGGDSASAVKKLGFATQVSHVSTGGGASLEFLEGIQLPGVACLNSK